MRAVSDELRHAEMNGNGHAAAIKHAAGWETTDVLARVLSERYPDIGEHLSEVARLSGEVAGAMGLSAPERDTIIQAATLHDIGKIAIPTRS